MQCLSCGSNELFNIYDFGPIPLVNGFNTSYKISSQKFPLQLCVCKNCWVCQLAEVPAPEVIFSNYMHFSSASIDNLNHLQSVAAELDELLPPQSSILEVGCNDGTLLAFLSNLGHQAIGVDPAKNMASIEIHQKNKTVFGNFGSETFDEILAANNGDLFDCILGLNVFAHFKKVQEAFTTAEKLLKDEGIFIFEVAYALETVFKGKYDTVYHEHVFNHSLLGLKNMLAKAGLKMIGASKLNTQGGSIRVFANKISCPNSLTTKSKDLEKLLRHEYEIGVDTIAFYKNINAIISNSIEGIKNSLKEFIETPSEEIFLVGAPARGVVVANTCHFDTFSNLIPIDDTPEKLGKIFPGLKCQVHSWDAIKQNIRVKKAILLSWNYKETMQRKLYDNGFRGEMIVFMPKIEIIKI